MEQTSGFQSLQVPTHPLPTPMDMERDGAPRDRQSPYAAFVAEASVREAVL